MNTQTTQERRILKNIQKYVQDQLNGPYKGRHTSLGEELDIDQSTLSRISRGVTDARLSNIQKLLDRFHRDEQLAQRYQDPKYDRRKGGEQSGG